MRKSTRKIALMLSVALSLAQMAVPVMASEVVETPDVVAISEKTEVQKDTISSGKCGDNMTYTLDTETGVLKISGTGSMYKYDVFNEFRPGPWYGGAVKTLIIEEGVETIGDFAFYNCNNLSSVELPKSLTTLGWNAFERCYSLNSIELPEGLSTIKSYAFESCTSLSSITLPDSLTSIGDYAFINCGNLTSIIIPKGSIDKLRYFVHQNDIYITETNGQFYNCKGSLIDIRELYYLQKCTIASIATQTYTGSAIKPALVIKYDGKQLKEDEDYTVQYKNNKVPGLATVVITGIGAYSGTVTKTFYISPKATAISSVSNASTGMTVKWKKVTYANGYYVYRGSTKIATITSGDTLSYVDKAANTNGTKYTYKVYAYTKASDGKIVKAAASASKFYYRLDRPAISSLTNSAAGRMLVKWGKNSKATGYQIQYSLNKDFSSAKTVTVSSNATVSKTITSLTKGKTYYVRVRSYKTVSNVKYYSAYSGTKYVKITR